MVGTIEQLEHTLLRGTESIAAGLDRLGIQFDYSLGLILEELRAQSQYLETIVHQLASINKTLQIPLRTQATELLNDGRDLLAKGMPDKAVARLLEAEKKNDADFLIQYYLGIIYLYDRDYGLLDPLEAKRHLLTAVRYGRAEAKSNSNFKPLTAEALFHGSVACLALADGEEGLDGMQLAEAYSLVSEAIRLAPDLLEARFQAAKYKALQGKVEKAMEILEVAICRDPRYAAKALADDSFLKVGTALDELLERFRHTSMTESEIALREAGEAAIRSEEFRFWGEEEGRRLHESAKNKLAHAQISHATGTFLGFLAAIEFARQALADASQSVRVRRSAEGEERAQEQRREKAAALEKRISRGKMCAWAGLVVALAGFPLFRLFSLIFLSPIAIYCGALALRNLPSSVYRSDRTRAGWAIGLGIFEVFVLVVFLSNLTAFLQHPRYSTPSLATQQQPASSSAYQRPEDPRELHEYLKARYYVEVVPGGVVLKPRVERSGVRRVAVTGDSITVNGERVTEPLLRAWLGDEAAPILRLSRLPPAERQALFSPRRVAP